MKQHRTTRSRAAVCLLFSIGLGSCESHSPTGGIAGRGTLAIRSDVSALVPEGSAQLHTVLRVGSSDNEVTAGVTWSSSDPLIVAVSSTGLVRGVAPGTAIVHAASQGQTADFSFSIRNGGFLADGGAVVAQQSAVVLSVPAGGLASNVSVFVDVASGAPADPAVVAGTAFTIATESATLAQPAQLIIKYKTASLGAGVSANQLVLAHLVTGQWQPITASTVLSATTQVMASITQFGTYAVYAQSAGTPVTSIGVTLQYASMTAGKTGAATATVVVGSAVTARSVTWSTSDSSVATVNASGVVTAVGAGTAQISATTGGLTGSASVTVGSVVTAPDVLNFLVNSTSLTVGYTYSQMPRDKSNATVTGTTVWTSSDPSIVVVRGPTGTVEGVAPGTATITAINDGRTASYTMIVKALSKCSGMRLALVDPVIDIGKKTTANANLDDIGRRCSPDPVAWASSNPAVATVVDNGLPSSEVAGVAAGTAIIRATMGTLVGLTTITVAPATSVARVSVSLGSSWLYQYDSTQARATAYDKAGNVLTPRLILWTTNARSIAAPDSLGIVRGVTVGSTLINATIDGVYGQTLIEIRAAPAVSTVSLSPFLGSGLQFRQNTSAYATLKSFVGDLVYGPPVVWTSSNNSILTITSIGNTKGLLTAVGTGTATITATAGSASASKTITIPVPAPVATVEVYAWDPLLHVGGTGSIGCTPYDAAKGIPTGTTATWSSSNTSVATIKGDPDNLYNTGGYVTAVAPGSAVMTCTIQGKTASTTITVIP